MALAERFSPNPDYGSGIYRRRIQILKTVDLVICELIDDYHEMACTLHHDGRHITQANAYIRRAPFTTCPGATVATEELVGLPLDIARRQLYGEGRPQRNCTHIFDLVAFAISQSRSDRWVSQIDFVVPDLTGNGAYVEALVDGRSELRWWISPDEVIADPSAFSGRSLFQGYARWAEAHFSGLHLDLALHIQKVVLVARGRRWKIQDESENSIRDEPERIGACFTFSEPQFSIAKPNPDYVRDFTRGLPTS